MFVEGRWLVEDPTFGSHRILDVFHPWLALLLSACAKRRATTEELLDVAFASGVPREAAAECIRSLQKARFLVRQDEDAGGRDDSAVRDLQWSLVSLRMDYSDAQRAIEADLETMDGFAETDPPPPQFNDTSWAGWRYWLPHPVLDSDDHVVSRLGHLLYFMNGILEDVRIGPLPRSRRVPPSHGASHPFDVTVFSREFADLGGANYLYDPDGHTLLQMEGCENPPEGDYPFVISVHAAVDRVQWRYRTSTAYPTLFLDLGHVIEVLFQVAQERGIELTELPAGRAQMLGAAVPRLGSVVARYGLSLATGRLDNRGQGS
ncbi:hypothetical protein [Streptomyces sp. NPDC059786]|uniref:hypothetical protein n=1 Tax=Streptomyces sp. NPDC059786 TaxID=3346946 RepID=UPI00365BFBBD